MATSWTLDRLRHLFFSEKENVNNDGRLGTCIVCVRWGGPSLETSNSFAMTLFIVIGIRKKKEKNIFTKADGWCSYGTPGL